MSIEYTNFSVPKNPKNFYCIICTYKTCNKKDFNKHNNTQKHKILTNHLEILPKIFICNFCKKNYKHASSLCAHKKKCNSKTTIIKLEENLDENIVLDINDINIKTNVEVSYLSSLILEVVKNNTELQKHTCELQKQNQEFQQEIQKQNQKQNEEMQKQNQDFQKQMMEICKTSNTVNNNINSHNKTFNLQVFLNEECKDAMNLSEFIESIHLKLPDLLTIGKLGYTEGISKIILKELSETAQNKRPMHCSDIKREIMYIKQENKWEKEGPENLTIKNAIKNIEQKNIALLMNDWKAEHPDHMKSESSENDEYLRLVNQITSGSEDNLNKVVRRIAKEVMINKKL
jgi:hypothetical protein